MLYDVQINNAIRRGLSYAELIMLPIKLDTFVRRENSNWIKAEECVELSHIVSRKISFNEETINDYSENLCCNSLESVDKNESYYDYEINDFSINDSSLNILSDTPTQEQISIPTYEYFKCKQKRKTAIIGVCTLGLAGLSLIGVGNTWHSNIFEGTSFSANAGIGFVLKCFSFIFLIVLLAIPYFVYSVFALIYYSIRISNLKHW